MQAIHHQSRLASDDFYLFNEGRHYRIYDKLGAHPGTVDGVEGANFAVWAPNAEQVSVIGDFNSWQPGEVSRYALVFKPQCQNSYGHVCSWVTTTVVILRGSTKMNAPM